MSRCIQMDQFPSAEVSQGASPLELREGAPKKDRNKIVIKGIKIISNRTKTQQLALSKDRNVKGEGGRITYCHSTDND